MTTIAINARTQVFGTPETRKRKKYRVSKVWHGFFIFSSQLFFYYFFFHYLCPVKWAKILTLDKKKKNFFCFVLSKSYLCTYE